MTDIKTERQDMNCIAMNSDEFLPKVDQEIPAFQCMVCDKQTTTIRNRIGFTVRLICDDCIFAAQYRDGEVTKAINIITRNAPREPTRECEVCKARDKEFNETINDWFIVTQPGSQS